MKHPSGTDRLFLKGIHGFSILGTVIGVGIMGVIAVGMSRIYNQSLDGQQSIEGKYDRESMKQMFLASVTCEDTIPTGTCTPGSLLAIKKRNPDNTTKVLASNSGSGTKFGKWTVRGECNSDGDGVVLRTAKLKPSGTLTSTSSNEFVPDALTKKAVTWADDASLLFPANVSVCGSSGFKWAHAFRYTLASVTTNDTPNGASSISTATLRRVTVIDGPALAFQVVNNVGSPWGHITSPTLDGIKCNESLGWYLASCYEYLSGDDNDIAPYYNGCVTNDFDGGAKLALTITCFKPK